MNCRLSTITCWMSYTYTAWAIVWGERGGDREREGEGERGGDREREGETGERDGGERGGGGGGCESQERYRGHLKHGGYLSCSIESHEVERQLLKLVGPVLILHQVSLQTQTGGREGGERER